MAMKLPTCYLSVGVSVPWLRKILRMRRRQTLITLNIKTNKVAHVRQALAAVKHTLLLMLALRLSRDFRLAVALRLQ